ncbi:MAG: chromosome segregation protein SMC [Clostridia bacterium]|nr:chromosome segregation protein SMC [Clostridia bacterium]
MRLKTLELQGFKSFPEKTVISFDEGITVIVGPNGSGKSNISDAMRWVLGELSTKSMRGQKMEDVIFSGSQKRSPMGYAEVTVTFDNSGADGTRIESMADYDEISVSRRYYRAGEGEYFINRKQVKLRDVQELFMNTGLGKGGYSIIGQGKIAEIISQKNEERRAVFEEAAGIAKYRHQKVDAMRKLDQINTNLSSAEIILGELESRVGPLEKEAEKARKYLDIYESKKAIDIALSLFDIDASKEKVDEVASKLVLAKEELDRTDDLISTLDAQNNATYDALMQSKTDSEQNIIDIGEAGARASAAESEIRIAETSNAHYAEMAESSKTKLAGETKLYEEALDDYNKMARQLAVAEENKKAISDKIAACDGELSDMTAETEKSDVQLAETEDMLEAAKAAEVEARVAASVARTQKESDEGKSAELDDEISKHESDIALYKEKIAQSEEKIAEYDVKIDGIKEKLDSFDARRSEIEKSRRDLAEEKNSLFLDASQRKHRIQNLVRMEELLDGYSSAVRFIVNEHKAGKIVDAKGKTAQIYGPVSKLIDVDEKYSRAIEVAFGSSLQNVVVGTEDDAKAVIAYLKKKNAGRATLYPVSTMDGRVLDAKGENISSQKGYIAVASDLVRADAKYAGIIRQLVGRIVVCDNIDSAASIAASTSYKFKIVTLDGQVVNAGGSFTGGSLSAEGGMLSRRMQIEKLGDEVKEIEKRSAAVEEKLASLDTDEETLKKEESVVLGSASVLKTLHDAETTQIEVIKSNIAVIEESKRKLADEREAAAVRAEKDEQSVEEYLNKESEARDKQEALLRRISEIEEEKQALALEMDGLRAKRAEFEVELAREEKFCEIGAANVADAKARLDAQRETLDSEKLTAEDLGRRMKENGEKIAYYMARRDEALEEKKTLEAKKIEISSESDRLEKKLVDIRARQSDAAHGRELAFENYTKLDATHTQLLEKQDALVGFLWDTYELTYSAASALGYEKITPEARSEAVQKQTKYKNIMRQLGNVNVNSIEEYAEVKERYEYYSTHIEDLHKSRADFEKIIGSLEERMKDDFARTINEINVNFNNVFVELFGGGRAEVKITDPSNILESGIEINVALPGKIVKSLSLLSGGEQAFVAIALYFAILKVNPSPFCIMDEIESALDEINVDKFAEYVQKYCDRTQFVLITHRRGTMEAAERLYGVTMQEKGVSQILSIDVSEIESKIGAEIK